MTTAVPSRRGRRTGAEERSPERPGAGSAGRRRLRLDGHGPRRRRRGRRDGHGPRADEEAGEMGAARAPTKRPAFSIVFSAQIQRTPSSSPPPTRTARRRRRPAWPVRPRSGALPPLLHRRGRPEGGDGRRGWRGSSSSTDALFFSDEICRPPSSSPTRRPPSPPSPNQPAEAARGQQAGMVLFAAGIWIENGEERRSVVRVCGTE
jgi:hypothetical protein